MEKELEVKVLNIDVDEVIKKLNNLGAKFLYREHQKNYNITSSKFVYIPIGSYLRIREIIDDKGKTLNITLTYKENIKNEEIRENNEYNVNISDIEGMLSILNFLGYDSFDIGEKERFSFEFIDSIIDIDIWDKKVYPFPYMEIESTKLENIYNILDLLEIGRENISLKSIKELQEEIK